MMISAVVVISTTTHAMHILRYVKSPSTFPTIQVAYNARIPTSTMATAAPYPTTLPAAAAVLTAAVAEPVALLVWLLVAVPLRADVAAEARDEGTTEGTSVMVTPAAAQRVWTADATSSRMISMA
jgi:hypothetical protein